MSESSILQHFSRARLPKSIAPSCVLAAGLSLLPIAMLLVNNRGAVSSAAPIYQVALGAVVAAVAGTAALSRIVAPHVAAAIIGAFGYGFFSMSWVGDGAGTTIIVFLWLAISALASGVLVWLLSDSRLVLNIASGVTAVLCLGMVGAFIAADSGSGASSEEVPAALAFGAPPASTPNVYLFVLDAFGQPDLLAEQFAEHDIDIDLTQSLAALEELGFIEDDNAAANYAETILSVPSALNGTFHHTEDDPLDSDGVWAAGRAALQGDNALVASLRSIGYEYWHSSSGIWDVSACNTSFADVCLGESISSIESTSAVWSMTPLHRIVGRPNPEELSEPTKVSENVLAIRAERPADSPYFVFSHIMSPHQPYRFDRSCNAIDPSENGSSLAIGQIPHFRQLFADQAVCLGLQLEQAMSDVVAADPSAIIILQGDHGSAFTIDFADLDWSDGELTERFGVFRMIRMPEQCYSDDKAAQSLINTAALVTSCIAGKAPVLVEPKTYLTSYSANFAVIEVELPPRLAS